MKKPFPELALVNSLADSLPAVAGARVEQLGTLPLPNGGGREFPLLAFTMGSRDPSAPVLGITGGVHGLERIGSQVVLSFLLSTAERLRWDETLQRDLERVRLVFVPLVNPVGMFRETRSNGNGVDLMRNSPVDSPEKVSFLVGGHRISPRLPWYRGRAGAPMEPENQMLCSLVRRESFASPTSLWLDVHSGYGIKDRIWFPFARSSKPFPHLAETYVLRQLLDRTYPYHVYQMEPQALEYTTHGDIWDYLYDERYRGIEATGGGSPLFIPLTLEMGSWIWVKKNPLQFFSFLGAFNPIKPHRKKRTLRRHLVLMDFLMRAVLSPSGWRVDGPEVREALEKKAHELWYSGSR